MPFSPKTLLRALALALASNAAVLAVMGFGLFLWPERLPVNTQNVFWLASGVNTAGLLLLGLRFWPVLLLNAFPAWLIFGDPLDLCLIGAASNALEALAAAALIRRVGGFAARGRFDDVRSIGALVVASLLAPLANTLVIPAWLCLKSVFPWSEYVRALGNWNLSNGAAMLFLTPLLVALARRERITGDRAAERALAAAAVATLGFVGFDGMLRGAGANLAFLAFPPVIYVAVRFGLAETAAALGLGLLSIYATLLLHARALSIEAAPAALWFMQACGWVLAATGLFVAAMGAERRRAEHRSLEATLAAERARLAALRYQLNPHFLFNALNSVRASLPLHEAVAREMLTDLSGYLRATLENREAEHAPLRDEVRGVREYLRIEQRRFGQRLQTRFDIEPAAENKNVPVFLLQPLVENAIRHGLENTPAPCLITVSARREGGTLRLEVANTGRWREPSERAGVGLANIRRRLALLHGDRARLSMHETGGRVFMHIELPES